MSDLTRLREPIKNWIPTLKKERKRNPKHRKGEDLNPLHDMTNSMHIFGRPPEGYSRGTTVCLLPIYCLCVCVCNLSSTGLIPWITCFFRYAGKKNISMIMKYRYYTGMVFLTGTRLFSDAGKPNISFCAIPRQHVIHVQPEFLPFPLLRHEKLSASQFHWHPCIN